MAIGETLDGGSILSPAKQRSPLAVPFEVVSAMLLVTIIGLLVLGVVSRYVFSLPIIWIDEVSSICFLLLSMLGAALAMARSEHMRLTLVIDRLPSRLQQFVNTFGLLLMLVFLAALVLPAIEYVIGEWAITSIALNIPVGFRASALVLGVVLMILFTVLRLVATSQWRDVAAGFMLMTAAGGILWLSSPHLIDLGYANIAIFLGLFVIVMLAMGVPIAFCFGLSTLCFLLFSTTVPTVVMIGRMDEGMSNMLLISIPIFVLLGCVLDATGMGKAIVEFLAALIGHVKAGMSYVLLGSLFLVSGISGSKISDMATVAPALFPEMKRRGNKPSEMIALLATGAAMADTVPPSIVLIVIGSVAGVSIAGLFTSGFVIAMVLLLILAVLARWKASGEMLAGAKRAPLPLMVKAGVIATPALVLPFLIRGLVGGGVATATEVSTIAVLYAMLIGCVIYGGIGWRKAYEMLVETTVISGAILFIMGTAAAMAWALAQTGFAFDLAAGIKDLPGGWYSFMLITIVIFVILGCFLEGLPAVMLMAPIMFPIAKSMGINDVHYSMVVVVAMNIGLMAPPIGIGFYIACKIGAVSPDTAMGAIWPYLAAMLVGLLLIAAIPSFSTAFL